MGSLQRRKERAILPQPRHGFTPSNSTLVDPFRNFQTVPVIWITRTRSTWAYSPITARPLNGWARTERNPRSLPGSARRLGSALDSPTLKSASLREQIKTLMLRCEKLTSDFEDAETSVEKTHLADQYCHALRQLESLQFLLSLVERGAKR
jgi:hypothetical protein